MTDLTPNDLSHLSDEEFNALAPQGYHATGPAKPLSPAAQAVLDAFGNASDGEYVEGVWVVNERTMLAAALRAAADQVVPQPPMLVEGGRTYEEAWTATVHEAVRRKLLAIADELEQS
jgi:hypothetical protein